MHSSSYVRQAPRGARVHPLTPPREPSYPLGRTRARVALSQCGRRSRRSRRGRHGRPRPGGDPGRTYACFLWCFARTSAAQRRARGPLASRRRRRRRRGGGALGLRTPNALRCQQALRARASFSFARTRRRTQRRWRSLPRPLSSGAAAEGVAGYAGVGVRGGQPAASRLPRPARSSIRAGSSPCPRPPCSLALDAGGAGYALVERG